MLEVSTEEILQPVDLYKPATSRRSASSSLANFSLVLHELVLVGLDMLSGSIKYIAKSAP